MEIELGAQAEADLEDLPLAMHARYDDVVERLMGWPRVSGVKWLAGQWKGHARVRFGDWRLIFHLEGDEMIVIDRVANRRDVYLD